MSDFPSHAELSAMQDQLEAMHRKMHEYAKAYPASHHDFVAIAVKLTDVVWKLDSEIVRAKFIEGK